MLSSGEDCRLLFVSSAAHTSASFDLEKAQGKHHTKDNFKRMVYYGNSKIYQVLVYMMLFLSRTRGTWAT
jgi:hypothetical protein